MDALAAPPPPLWLRRGFVLLLTVIVLAVAVQYAVKAAESRSAFVRWRNQIQALGDGVDIYQRYTYPNAPIMALILYPLSLLPKMDLGGAVFDLGALCWFLLKVAMTVLAFRWSVQIIQSPGRPFLWWGQAAMLLLTLRPIIGDLSHGNVNLLILFLVVAALFAFHQGRDGLGGVLLALGIACKVTPALFVVYFLWKRAWRAVVGCAVGLVLFLLIVPGTIVGQTRNWELLNSWMDVMIWPYVRDGWVWTEHNNQSIPGLVYRLGTDNPSFLDEEDKPVDYHNLVSLEPWAAKGIVKGLGIAFLLVMCWSCRTPTRPRENWMLAAEYSLILLGMLLFSERTWKHHCVTLLLPFGVLCYYLTAFRASSGWRLFLVGTIAVAVVLISSTSTTLWELLGDKRGAKLAQVYGGYTWAQLLLVVAVVALLRKHRGPAAVLDPKSEGKPVAWRLTRGAYSPRSPATT